MSVSGSLEIRRQGRAVFLLALLGVCGVSGVRAQDSSVHSYWEQLEAASTVAELSAVGRPAEEARAQLYEGLFRLRLYELSRDRTDAFVGRRQLERAVASSPRDAWTRFGLGVLLARGPDTRVLPASDAPTYFATPFSNAVKRAPRELRAALELDPELHIAAYALAELALDLGDVELTEEAVRLLEQDGRDTLPRALQLRSLLQARLGAAAHAAVLADSMRVRGGDASLAAHARAAALMQQQGAEAAGEEAYFEGVDALTEAGAAEYFDALLALLERDDHAVWARADLAERRLWLRRFWDVQAGLAGVPLPERLAEHYRRLAEARRDGRVAHMGAGLGVGDFRLYGMASEPEFLMVRHGDSLRLKRVLYCGYQVLELPQPLQPHPGQCLQTPTGRYRAARSHGIRLYTFQAQEHAHPGTTYYPPFERHLSLTWEVLQFRGDGGGTDFVTALAVPSASARDLRESGGAMRAQLALALVDSAAGRVQRAESTRAFAPVELAPDAWVLLWTTLPTRATRDVQYRITLTNPERTAGRIVGGRTDVRDYSAATLALSDVVLSPLDGAPSFARGDVRLSLAPGREFRTDEVFALYYEVYGLSAEVRYRTELRIEPQSEGVGDALRSLLPGRTEAIVLTFDDVAPEPHAVFGVQQTRTVDIAGLKPGAYRLRVTVTDGRTQNTAVRERTLIVEVP